MRTADDVIEFMLAGASAVGIGTALFYEPLLCRQINARLQDYMAAHQLAGLGALVGALKT